MSSIPGPGRFHMLQSNKVYEPQLLSPCSATEVTAIESSPHLLQLEKAWAKHWRSSTAKNKIKIKKINSLTHVLHILIYLVPTLLLSLSSFYRWETEKEKLPSITYLIRIWVGDHPRQFLPQPQLTISATATILNFQWAWWWCFRTKLDSGDVCTT